MDSRNRNRNVWIIVAIVVVLVCCCALAVAAALAVGAGWFTVFPTVVQGGLASVSEYTEQTFDVGAAPQLTLDNFAGAVTVRAGTSGQIRVSVTKKATSSANLNRIEVQITPQDGGLSIQSRSNGLTSNRSVQFEISAPADAILDLHTGAGNIDVQGFSSDVTIDSGAGSVTITDVNGSLDAHSGAGSISVRGATGPARLDTGAGSIDYLGTPQGSCRFETGTGSIQLNLPADLNATVDLSTGVGSIDLGFDVAGQVSKREVQGTIGSGGPTSIYAHTGTGSIDLNRR